MTDVVEIAKERMATLAVEIGALEGFVRMAEKLVKENQSESGKARDPEVEKALGSAHSAIARLFSESIDGNEAKDAAKDANGAGAESGEVPVRELTAQERQH
jgi:hypothetical protein